MTKVIERKKTPTPVEWAFLETTLAQLRFSLVEKLLAMNYALSFFGWFGL